MEKKEYLALFEKTQLFIQEVPSLFHYPYYVGECQTKKLFSSFNPSFSKVFSFKENNYVYWIYDENEMFKEAEKEFEKGKTDRNYFSNQLKTWKKSEQRYYSVCLKLQNFDFSTTDLNKLKSLYLEFKNAYLEEYGMAMITDLTGPFAEKKIIELLSKKFLKNSPGFQEALMKLSAPIKESFVGREQYELYKIALRSIKNKDQLISMVREHTKQYCWIQNNYLNIQELTEDYFLERINFHIKKEKEMKNYCNHYFSSLDKNKLDKRDLIRKLNLSEEFKVVIEMSEIHGHWQDLRKRANLIGHGHIKKFLKRASCILNCSYEDLTLLTIKEFEEVLSKKKVNWEEIRERKENVVVIYSPNQNYIYVKEEAKKFKEILEKKMKTSHVNDFRGNTVSIGKVKGIARVVLNPKETNFKEGEILITSMTRPEFVPLMKKASAIITNEGGMTCHAAIISRELNKPCIVGTKIATKVIKDGDLIEVDANHGVVRILDRITS